MCTFMPVVITKKSFLVLRYNNSTVLTHYDEYDREINCENSK